MSTEMKINSQPFEGWTIETKLEGGSFGVVYRASHDGAYSAIKHIVIPNDAELKGKTPKEITDYYKPRADQLHSEISIMQELAGNPGIVRYMDHKIRELKERGGWEILIRMELLTSLKNYIKDNGLRFGEVLNMGIQLCDALEECRQKPIIHRDIKIDNIFIDPARGQFKLGDFGVSKKLSGDTHGRSITGTEGYMAPEIKKRQNYDHRVDVYSLGIAMYILLNDNTLPFMKKGGNVGDEEASYLEIEREGRLIPALVKWGTDVDRVLQKACAYYAKDRYETFGQMEEELSGIKKASSDALLMAYAIMPINGKQNVTPAQQNTSKGTIDANEQEQNQNTSKMVDNKNNAVIEKREVSSNKADIEATRLYEEGVKLYKQNKYVEAKEYLLKAAEQGYADAQYDLGCMYNKGEGVEKDTGKAVEWFIKAGNQGNVDAQSYLGILYDTGNGVEKDLAKAVEWFKRAAEQGHLNAQFCLGYKYHKGEGVVQDEAKSLEWFRKAAEQGDVDAQGHLECVYNRSKAAERRNSDAQYKLGNMYSKGEGVARNKAKTVEWYRKAAEQGNIHAEAKLKLIDKLKKGY